MANTLSGEFKRYVDWSERDEAALRVVHARARGRLEAIAAVFYARVLAHEAAREVLQRGETQLGRLKTTLTAWLERLLAGPWDDEYDELRLRIGRAHVRIGLPQHYMVAGMNVMRAELERVIGTGGGEPGPDAATLRAAVHKALDLDLAVMLDSYREDLLAARMRAERLSAYGQIVGSIGHELRNPLGVIETSLFLLRGKAADDEKVKRQVERIGNQVRIANGIIANLLSLIRDEPLVRERLTPGALVEEAARSVARPPGVELVLDVAADAGLVDGSATQLRQVVVNLVDNAVHATGDSGRVRVSVCADEAAVRVAVEDAGPGVDESIRHRLFEPLVTTKTRGTGLGLALVRRIVERHGGSVTHEPARPRGARFVVTLPRADGLRAQPAK